MSSQASFFLNTPNPLKKGGWNFFIYIRPSVISIKQKKKSLSFWKAFIAAIKSRGESSRPVRRRLSSVRMIRRASEATVREGVSSSEASKNSAEEKKNVKEGSSGNSSSPNRSNAIKDAASASVTAVRSGQDLPQCFDLNSTNISKENNTTTTSKRLGQTTSLQSMESPKEPSPALTLERAKISEMNNLETSIVQNLSQEDFDDESLDEEEIAEFKIACSKVVESWTCKSSEETKQEITLDKMDPRFPQVFEPNDKIDQIC